MDRRHFIAGIASVPIASILPAAAEPAWWARERALIAEIGQATVARLRLVEAGAPAATIATSNLHLQTAVRALHALTR